MLFQKGHTTNVGKKWIGKKWTEEQKAKHKILMKIINNRNDIKLERSQSRIGKKLTTEHRKNLSISHLGHKGYWTGKVRIDRKGKTYEEIYGIEKAEYLKENYSKIFKRLWNMPEYRQKQEKIKGYRMSKILSKVCQRPNSFEKECGQLLEEQFPNKFKYCGNGSISINNRFPDYICEDLKIVVLCNGLYWHLWRYGLENTLENKRSIELKESEPFRQAGYEVWFIWENCRNRSPVGNYIKKKIIQNDHKLYEVEKL